MTHYISKSELALAEFIDAHIDLFAESSTDWLKVRAYCIQRCVERGYTSGKPNPIADACEANNVHYNYYARSKVYENAAAIRKILPQATTHPNGE